MAGSSSIAKPTEVDDLTAGFTDLDLADSFLAGALALIDAHPERDSDPTMLRVLNLLQSAETHIANGRSALDEALTRAGHA